MAKEQAATLRAQWLGQQLRDMREAAKLTLKEVGNYINRNQSTVSRLESGVVAARVPEVLAYLDVCGIDDIRRRDDLTTMARDAWQKGWWNGFRASVAGTLIDRIWLENRAREIYSFQVSVVPGLLQTRAYAETLIRFDQPDASDEQVQRYVDVRLTRQQRLDQDDPLKVCAVIDEAVLHRPVGGASVMREQVQHLIDLGTRRHIQIRLLPADAGEHASPDGSFDLLGMPHPYPWVASVDTPAGNVVAEAEKAEALVRTYDRLRDAALSEKETAAYLTDLARRLE